MSRALILDSLEIRRFRCFQELRIGRLGPVNLIVGKNNVGKSTLLEALRLYAPPLFLLICSRSLSHGTKCPPKRPTIGQPSLFPVSLSTVCSSDADRRTDQTAHL